MQSFQVLICLLTLSTSSVSANVEKTIFLGPEPVNIPPQSPTLADLNIDVLTPENWSLRSHIDAIFPTEELQRGRETWLILDGLTEGQRYEVRVCWLATQPTAFHLETYTLPHVFDTPDLITSLYNYSMSRQTLPNPAKRESTITTEREASILFLRVSAAAEYFTLNHTLMAHPEPVLTDLILDPFLFNVLPRTLVPTVGYICFVAAVSWILATKMIVPWLRALMAADDAGEGHESSSSPTASRSGSERERNKKVQ